MSKKQAKTKQSKLAQIQDLANELGKKTVSGPKALIVTPQVPVSIHGKFPDQELFVETPNGSGTRHRVKLTPANAYSVLMDLLIEKAGSIELERQLSEERNNRARKKYAQPDWRLIAKHAQAEIREGLVEASLTAKGSIIVLPTRAKELQSNKTTKSLEEMEL